MDTPQNADLGCKNASFRNSFIACSHYIAHQDRKTYRRDSVVIYPNVDVENFQIGQQDGDFYITASRIVPSASRISLHRQRVQTDAFAKTGCYWRRPLVERVYCDRAFECPGSGYQPDDVLRDHLMRARAFVSRQKRISELLLWKRKPVGRRSSHLDGVELPRR